MANKKYTKYKTLYLPQKIAEAIILYHKHRIEDYEKVRLDFCFDFISNIIHKSSFNRTKEESKDLFALMAATYLKKRYKNRYKIHKDFLVNNSLLYKDESFEGQASTLYIQNNVIYNSLIESTLRDLVKEDNNYNLYISYCFTEGISISLLGIINTSDSSIEKNRIFDDWYRIKIPISRSNKSVFISDYESDSKFIRDKAKYIGKLGRHFRNNFALDTEAAIRHTLKQFQKELKEATSNEQERKAYNRSVARINSIWSIDKGRLNKSLRFNRNSTNNRLDTNLTNMASDLKPFILGWDDMVYLDLKNSQPVLFNIEINKYYNNASNDLRVEIDRYRRATFAGKWYEELEIIFNENRNTCKEIWMCIAYSRNKSYQNYKKLFKKVYPEIYKIIESIKSSNYKNFAIKLQKIESEIFIDKICRALTDIDIVPFTVHDAIIVKKSEVNQTLQIMKEILFKYLGDTPKISIE